MDVRDRQYEYRVVAVCDLWDFNVGETFLKMTTTDERRVKRTKYHNDNKRNKMGTHDVRRTRPVRVRRRVRVATAVVVAVRSASETAQASEFGHGLSAASADCCSGRGRRRIPFVDHEINRHFALQTTDVTMTKIVAKFMNLYKKRIRHFFIFFYSVINSCIFILLHYYYYSLVYYTCTVTVITFRTILRQRPGWHTHTHVHICIRDEGPLVTEDYEEFSKKKKIIIIRNTHVCDGVVLPRPLQIGHISWLEHTAVYKTGNIIIICYTHSHTRITIHVYNDHAIRIK